MHGLALLRGHVGALVRVEHGEGLLGVARPVGEQPALLLVELAGLGLLAELGVALEVLGDEGIEESGRLPGIGADVGDLNQVRARNRLDRDPRGYVAHPGIEGVGLGDPVQRSVDLPWQFERQFHHD